ncbi:hypothetical protein [Deinococcus sonorensis]|uniref:Uncharacterized protein n=2 Tax=Deinococcus sonorensis TaxID=309891 RepID=A0AAU7UG76_9DEIO
MTAHDVSADLTAEFGLSLWIDTCADTRAARLQVPFPALAAFARRVSALGQVAAACGQDDVFLPALRLLRRARYLLATSPLSTGHPLLWPDAGLEDLKRLRRLLPAMHEEAAPLAEELWTLVTDLRQADVSPLSVALNAELTRLSARPRPQVIPGMPRPQARWALVIPNTPALLACQADLEARWPELDLLPPGELRRDTPAPNEAHRDVVYEAVYICGSLAAQHVPAWVLHTPRAEQTVLLQYDWLWDDEPGFPLSALNDLLAPEPLTVRPAAPDAAALAVPLPPRRPRPNRGRTELLDAAQVHDEDEEEDPTRTHAAEPTAPSAPAEHRQGPRVAPVRLEPWAPDYSQARGTAGTGAHGESTVPARLLILQGGHQGLLGVWMETEGRAYIVEAEDGSAVCDLPLGEVRAGQHLVLRERGDLQLIHGYAAARHGEAYGLAREVHLDFKRDLRRAAARYATRDLACAVLASFGAVSANPQNFSNWCRDDKLRPREWADMAALVRFAGRPERDAQPLWDNADQLWTWHREAGRQVSELLEQAVAGADLAPLRRSGTQRFTLGEEGHTLVAYRIEDVTAELADVPQSRLEKPFRTAL